MVRVDGELPSRGNSSKGEFVKSSEGSTKRPLYRQTSIHHSVMISAPGNTGQSRLWVVWGTIIVSLDECRYFSKSSRVVTILAPLDSNTSRTVLSCKGWGGK